MTPELENMLDDERDTVLLYSSHLRPLNPDMQDDYRRYDWKVLAWEIAACGAMCAMLFLLGAF